MARHRAERKALCACVFIGAAIIFLLPFVQEKLYYFYYVYSFYLFHGCSIVHDRCYGSPGHKCYVTFSSTAKVNAYTFYLPITSLLWKQKGFEPIVILVGSKSEWISNKTLNIVWNQLQDSQIRVFNIPVKESDHGSETFTSFSQVLRLYAASLDSYLKDTDYLITTDVDLWVHDVHCLMSRDYAIITNSDCCGDFFHNEKLYKMYPMSHIGMPVQTWRTLFPEVPFVNMADKQLSKVADDTGLSLKDWYFDQKLASIRLKDWKEKGNRVEEIPWNVNAWDRNDKSNLMVRWGSVKPKYDAHLPPEGYQPSRWWNIRQLLEPILQQQELRLIDQYRSAFVRSMKHDS